MARTVARTMAAPLLFLNMIMYFIVLAFASWCINRHINGTTNHPSMGGNGATPYFLTFSILAAVLGIVSKVAGGGHLRAWRSDSLAGAGASAIIAWAVTALAFGAIFIPNLVQRGTVLFWQNSVAFIGSIFFYQSPKGGDGLRFVNSDFFPFGGLACKEINIGGYRGWRLMVLESFIIILGVTQLLYVMLLHAGFLSSRYGPGYRNHDYGTGPGAEPVPKGAGVTGTRV